MTVQPMTTEDYPQLISIWKSTPEMCLNDRDDSEEAIARFLSRNPSTCFTALEEGRLAGCVLCGYDGRCAYIYHMCVDADFRHRGVASSLMKAVEEELIKMGASKSALVVFKTNTGGQAFWKSQGWVEREDLFYYSRSITGIK